MYFTNMEYAVASWLAPPLKKRLGSNCGIIPLFASRVSFKPVMEGLADVSKFWRSSGLKG